MNAVSIDSFLRATTPTDWIAAARNNERLLLIDHANCERKAASSVLSMINQNSRSKKMCLHLSKIAREEMRHYEQVLDVLEARGHQLSPLSPSRYARGLHRFAKLTSTNRVLDEFLIAAIIEARSCERFGLLVDVLDNEVAALYEKLRTSEQRHFEIYLQLAAEVPGKVDIETRLNGLLAEENKLIVTPDARFRFHSGPPLNGKHSSVSSVS